MFLAQFQRVGPLKSAAICGAAGLVIVTLLYGHQRLNRCNYQSYSPFPGAYLEVVCAVFVAVRGNFAPADGRKSLEKSFSVPAARVFVER